MKIACIYWWTHSVGGIATHLNNLRRAALDYGDQFDILHSLPWKKRKPRMYPNRKWVMGGDTKIWVDGDVPQNNNGAEWLKKNYDAIVFGFLCPGKTNRYPTPEFLYFYDVDLPKVAWVMDGYFDDYPEWAYALPERLDGILCPLDSYAKPLRARGVNPVISAFPFHPMKGKRPAKQPLPLMVWPNQWKEIKGVTSFLEIIPDLPSPMSIELYSSGIRYYQLRTTDTWRKAVSEDVYERGGFHGQGRAVYFGNVDLPVIHNAICRAWYTINLQGMKSKYSTYAGGSYNNTEVEALYYGAIPILHNSGLKTAIPSSTCLWLSSPGDIPGMVKDANRDRYALDPERQKTAREFVLDTHLASHRYLDMRRLLEK